MPSYLDLGLIAVILISALLAMLRGVTREVLAIASWIAAAAAARYLYPYLLPYVLPHLSKEPWASLASATVIFIVALIVVSIITVNISDAILDSKVGALDRSLGFLFGAVRGFVLCVIAFVMFSKLASPEKQRELTQNAKMRPLLESVGTDIQQILPHNLLNDILKTKSTSPTDEPPPEGDAATDKAAPDADSPAPLPPPRGSGGKEP